MKRAAVVWASVFAVGTALVLPAASAAEPSTTAPAVRSAETDAVTAAKVKKAKKAKLKASRSKVTVNGTARLKGVIKPKGKRHVAFQQKLPGTSKWRGAGAKVTTKKGKTSTRVQLHLKGTYKYRLAAKGKNSNVVKIKATGNTPPVPPVPPNPPKSLTVAWPEAQSLEVDRHYDVPVQVKPAGNVQVSIEHKTGDGWDAIYGGTANTGNDGKVSLILSIPDTGSDTFRVNVAKSDLISDTVTKSFEDGGDTLYNVPIKLPNQNGKMVKAQEFPMNYPKLPAMKNPLDGSALVLPSNIGGPLYPAGPPKCAADPSIDPKDCGIPGQQFRIMYTTERWFPNNSGGGSASGYQEGATGLLLLPGTEHGKVAGYDPDKVFVWAHPTLGQSNQCSISRGVDEIPIVNGATGAKSMGPGGMDINLTDMLFFIDHMLRDGWTIVMPDYLGIAVNGPSSNQKTYVVGQQEARDIFYAADALQTPAKNGKGWPGMPDTPTQKFVVAGHSQGGHAAIWAGIKADELKAETGQRLLGVSATAPATDMNMLVEAQWDRQANWIIGPEVIQTWAGYLGAWAFQNNTVSDAAVQNLARYAEYCTTQAYAASYEFFPGGLQSDGTPFMKDPNDPNNAQMFYNWAKIFGAQTPVVTKNQFSNDVFPKDMPLQLISGTADQVVLSQITAGFQENFCSAVDQMDVYWTPVTTGATNPNPPATDMLQAADHLNPLTFTWTNYVTFGNGGLLTTEPELSGGALRRFVTTPGQTTSAETACAPQTMHKVKPYTQEFDSWYVLPALLQGADDPKFYETKGAPQLAPPAKAGPGVNPPPAPGAIDKTGTQTKCGYLFKSKIAQNQPNPDCYQWGMFPYGQGNKEAFLYQSNDNALNSKTWAGKNGNLYPYIPKNPN